MRARKLEKRTDGRTEKTRQGKARWIYALQGKKGRLVEKTVVKGERISQKFVRVQCDSETEKLNTTNQKIVPAK